MSCFIVEKITIDRIVAAFRENEWYLPSRMMNMSDDEIGKELYKVNVKSFCLRYRENEADFQHVIDDYKYEEPRHDEDLKLKQIKSCSCWQYQSCECGCDKDELYNQVSVLQLDLSLSVICHRIPQYNELRWE